MANEVSRHVGDAELIAKPIAKPKLFRTKANAAAAIAPAITGPQLSLKPVATSCSGVSEIVILISHDQCSPRKDRIAMMTTISPMR